MKTLNRILAITTICILLSSCSENKIDYKNTDLLYRYFNEFHENLLQDNEEINIITCRLSIISACAPLININSVISKICREKPNSNIFVLTDSERVFELLDEESIQKLKGKEKNIIIDDLFTLKKYDLDKNNVHNFYFKNGKLLSVNVYSDIEDLK